MAIAGVNNAYDWATACTQQSLDLCHAWQVLYSIIWFIVYTRQLYDPCTLLYFVENAPSSLNACCRGTDSFVHNVMRQTFVYKSVIASTQKSHNSLMQDMVTASLQHCPLQIHYSTFISQHFSLCISVIIFSVIVFSSHPNFLRQNCQDVAKSTFQASKLHNDSAGDGSHRSLHTDKQPRRQHHSCSNSWSTCRLSTYEQ